LPFGKKHHEFVHGKGSIHGEYADNTLSSSLYQIWYDILGRCYNTKFKDYKKYGGKGVHVSNEWLDFGRFKHEVMLLPRWEEAYKNLHRHVLSRAYYNSDVYSFNTCVWLTCPEHRIYCENASPFTMYSVPESRYIGTFLSIKECAYEYDLYESRIYDVLQGYTTEYAGYSFAYLPFTKDILYRHPLAIDQLQTVIDMLKSDPFSRRIGYSLWNSEKIPLMQLPPCHGVHVAFHVTCVDGVSALSLSMVQRSADVFLGLPTNISSYALLLHMVAQCVGMIPGELTIFIHNSHLYSAHFRVAQRQLERYPLKLPYLILDKTIDNINMFTVDSFSLQKYEHHLPLQGKLIV
jgi:thymidylate synthase